MKYIITSAQEGASLDVTFFESLLNYCKVNKSKLVVIPIKHRKKIKASDMTFDEEVLQLSEKGYDDQYIAKKFATDLSIIKLITKNNTYEVIRHDFDKRLSPYLLDKDKNLNDNIMVSTMQLDPMSSEPLNGLARFAYHSVIFGSPKLFMKPIPTSNYKMPKIVMTTGSITKPEYKPSKRGAIAEQDHTISAIIVEIENNVVYHYRQLEANNKGHFTDLGVRYTPNKTYNNNAEAIILGDLHNGSQDQQVEKATLEIRKLLKPKYLVYHDVMDSYSINHHHDNNIIIKAQKTEASRNSLEKELDNLVDYFYHVNSYKNINKSKLVVVSSNHDEALSRYIREGRFFYDEANLRISLKLALQMLDGNNPIRAYFEQISNKKVKDIRFLDIDEDFILSGVQLGNHGHLGSNGSKGNIKSQELGAKKSIIGHSHSPQIWHKIYQVGTSTRLKLEYNKGSSSWVNCHCVLYSDGTRQLINIIDGKWKI